MTRTLLLPVDASDVRSPESQASLHAAAGILQAGGTVAFPTETVYGLGANALNEAAVRRIFEAKQRPNWDPLIVHISGAVRLDSVVAETTAADRALMQLFWPGPLTLLLPKTAAVPDLVTAGRPKVGVRMPVHPIARMLIEIAGLPLAAPSANSFGHTSPTTAAHVLEDLDGRVDAILDGGPTTMGLESTVMDANIDPPTIYRPGMISLDQIRQVLQRADYFNLPLEQDALPNAALPSPGVGLRHYAPQAQLILVEFGDLIKAVEDASRQGGLTGVLLPAGLVLPAMEKLRIFHWGEWKQPEILARRLFLGLRELDRQGVSRILCPVPDHEELGEALRDRLNKAAKPR